MGPQPSRKESPKSSVFREMLALLPLGRGLRLLLVFTFSIGLTTGLTINNTVANCIEGVRNNGQTTHCNDQTTSTNNESLGGSVNNSKINMLLNASSKGAWAALTDDERDAIKSVATAFATGHNGPTTGDSATVISQEAVVALVDRADVDLDRAIAALERLQSLKNGADQ